MASTLASGTLIVNTNEKIVLDGNDLGGTRSFTESSIRVYSRQFRNITSDVGAASDILNFKSSPSTDFEFDTDTVKYVRVTNLDDTHDMGITVDMDVTPNESFTLRIKPGHSFIMGSPLNYFLGSQGTPDKSVEVIKACKLSGTSIDIEVVVGSA